MSKVRHEGPSLANGSSPGGLSGSLCPMLLTASAFPEMGYNSLSEALSRCNFTARGNASVGVRCWCRFKPIKEESAAKQSALYPPCLKCKRRL